jgi:8-oxo-dGTP pyrophosphatase MutT (NUDIX family)|tara:strand:+ start:4146 stop:4604 length:459 start_codon:yes stop_codon:yes gene_type:complete
MNYKWNKFLTEKELKTVGIVVCLDDKQRFLILRRSNIDERGGQWTIPGGHIDDKDRSVEAGAVRELDEETDLLCDTSDLIYLGEPKPKKHYFLTLKWTGRVNVDKPNPITNEIEHDDWKWATIEQIKDIENTEFPIYLLEKALKIAGFDKNG